MKLDSDWRMLVVAAVFGVLAIVYLYREARDCHAKGGRLVRGMFWVECVEPRP